METHEHYDRQHQDLRTENGIKYGDVIEKVNFEYSLACAIFLVAIKWIYGGSDEYVCFCFVLFCLVYIYV